jgi:hypothetical protein
MVYRAILLTAAFIGLSSLASAQTSPPLPAKGDSQSNASGEVRITLKMQWLELTDNTLVEVSELKKLPTVSSHAIYDQQRTEILLRYANGDKRGSVRQVPALTVLNGEKHDLSPGVPVLDVQGNGTLQATASNDRKTIQIQLTWAKQKTGKERLPVTTASVPIGSHLLVRVADKVVVTRNTYYRSYCEQLLGELFGWKPQVGLARETLRVFLLVTPSIVSQEPVHASAATGSASALGFLDVPLCCR